MQWDFSAEQVVKGEVAYGLRDFRADLATEVRRNLPQADAPQQARAFDLLYDLCHWQARGKDLDSFLATCAYDPPACEFLREVHPMMAPNVTMLGAILQRMIMNEVESGLPLERALANVDLEHRRIADATAAAPASRCPA